MSSYVYMIRAGDHCKVGKADNPTSRINGFRTGCPYQIEVIGTVELDSHAEAFDLESYLHRAYREDGHHAEREWFKYSSDLAARFLAIGSARSTSGIRWDTIPEILRRVVDGGRVVTDLPLQAVFDLDVRSPTTAYRLCPVSAPNGDSDQRHMGLLVHHNRLWQLSPQIEAYEWRDGAFIVESLLGSSTMVMPIERLDTIHNLLGRPRLDVESLLATTQHPGVNP